MTLDEILVSLFPAGHAVEHGPWDTLQGTARIERVGQATVVGLAGGAPLGVDGASLLAERVLATVEAAGRSPIVFLVDTSSQNMARRDELLGLNEYLAHLAKCLALAAMQGHRTVSVLFGRSAAGAFIATALSSQTLIALPAAEPSVMDLPSISRVTKLPLEQLTEMAKSTPIFAPGLQPLFAIGAVAEIWDEEIPLATRLANLLREPAPDPSSRERRGLERKGRLLAHSVAERVATEAAAHGRI